MDVAALKAMQEIASTAGLGVLRSAFKVLASLKPEDGAVALLDSKATFQNNVSFQVGVAEIDDDGSVTMGFGGFHLAVDKRRRRFLFFRWDSKKVRLWAAVQTMTFNEPRYATAREKVRERLEAYRDDYLWDISPNAST